MVDYQFPLCQNTCNAATDKSVGQWKRGISQFTTSAVQFGRLEPIIINPHAPYAKWRRGSGGAWKSFFFCHQSASCYKRKHILIPLWCKRGNLFTVCRQFKGNVLPLIAQCKWVAFFVCLDNWNSFDWIGNIGLETWLTSWISLHRPHAKTKEKRLSTRL